MELEDVTRSLISTVSDPSFWDRALADICAFTGTERALISLRDRATAHIIIPQAVEDQSDSPLIHGFSEEAVGAYLTTYAEVDPWTRIERQTHPYQPYALSNHISQNQLRNSEFWPWLSKLGIDDSVVSEIGVTGKFWAAINLYFGDTTPEKAKSICRKLGLLLPTLKPIWAAGRAVQIDRQTSSAIELILDRLPLPSVILARDGTILHLNESAATLFETLLSEPARKGAILTLPQDLNVAVEGRALGCEFRRSSAPTDFEGFATLSPFESAELISGEPASSFLLSFHPRGPAQLGPHVTPLAFDLLTDREATLVRLIADGQKLKEAETSMNISHARVMQLWRSARQKLGIRDIADLRVAMHLSNADAEKL